MPFPQSTGQFFVAPGLCTALSEDGCMMGAWYVWVWEWCTNLNLSRSISCPNYSGARILCATGKSGIAYIMIYYIKIWYDYFMILLIYCISRLGWSSIHRHVWNPTKWPQFHHVTPRHRRSGNHSWHVGNFPIGNSHVEGFDGTIHL